jgi:uracil-DNA glycosylase
METINQICCEKFPCHDIAKDLCLVPPFMDDTDRIRLIMIAEAPALNQDDYFYAPGMPFYLQTTIQAFQDAGVTVSNMDEFIAMGIYITTAVKCAKTQYAISLDTIKNCSCLLEKELALFPNTQIFMLMGDVAIKAFNLISKRINGKHVIPGGSTYKLRNQQFYYENKRVFPSYLQTGKNYLIEKSKRNMIAEDIRGALKCLC